MLETYIHKNSRFVVGLMSGTSLDGIDAALVRIGGQGLDADIELAAFTTVPYSGEVREKLKQACSLEHSSAAMLCGINFYLGRLFADAVRRLAALAGIAPDEIDLIGSHGQTVWHIPAASEERWWEVPSTLQIGDISVIAKETGIPVVGDFRTADMAVGGQGAPLVPYFDYMFLRHPSKGRIAQNIGGIGNCTVIPAGASSNGIFAFDTGPGNMLIDQAVYRLSGGERSYDEGGAWAARGKANQVLLDRMLEHPFFAIRPPKTTGREAFGAFYAEQWLEEAQSAALAPEDIVATFTAFTAQSIVRNYRDFIFPSYRIEEIIVSGGGAHNRTLMKMIEEELPAGCKLTASEEWGIDGDAKEAIAFAVFADHYMFGLPNHLSSATGASRDIVMGKLALPN
ncbi:Anhydro-N-acetylmuramic acid kinase [Paenibacillus sp. CECT 9249]|uniref:anhydro-N-acetylmuramic acid kinase n=1 Tax=Paenibacillus sp. CECT 9249 TaxID=2845385 RepID=UPI001E2D4C15|nr:anhydro-N-acetylmuramic acid kinase [Paenibacillus sp. CECT 9249]CAH0121041.1 Anhydro-N-acetylmuramic acid kinase [Paenibacillus sp. CECT 9249]